MTQEHTHGIRYWSTDDGSDQREIERDELTPPAWWGDSQKEWAREIMFSLRRKGWFAITYKLEDDNAASD